jgi:hypothetical protein
MCLKYMPVTRAARLMTFFGVEYAKEELLQREVFPMGMAPFIRLSVEGQEGGKPALVAEDGMFGLLCRTSRPNGSTGAACTTSAGRPVLTLHPILTPRVRCVRIDFCSELLLVHGPLQNFPMVILDDVRHLGLSERLTWLKRADDDPARNQGGRMAAVDITLEHLLVVREQVAQDLSFHRSHVRDVLDQVLPLCPLPPERNEPRANREELEARADEARQEQHRADQERDPRD